MARAMRRSPGCLPVARRGHGTRLDHGLRRWRRSGPGDADPAALPDGVLPIAAGERLTSRGRARRIPRRTFSRPSRTGRRSSTPGRASWILTSDRQLPGRTPISISTSSTRRSRPLRLRSVPVGRVGQAAAEASRTLTRPSPIRTACSGNGTSVPRCPSHARPPNSSGRHGRAAAGCSSWLRSRWSAALLGGGLGGAVGYSFAGDRDRRARSPIAGRANHPRRRKHSRPRPGPVEAVAARCCRAWCSCGSRARGRGGEGSGVVLSPDGLLLTNNHVVEAAAAAAWSPPCSRTGPTAPAEIVGRDPGFDLAVLRARNVSGLTPIELGNSDTVRVGQQVVAFGSPLGLGGTVTTGIISAINRPVSVGGDRVANDATVLNALQTDAAINPGNSGGPLVDMQRPADRHQLGDRDHRGRGRLDRRRLRDPGQPGQAGGRRAGAHRQGDAGPARGQRRRRRRTSPGPASASVTPGSPRRRPGSRPAIW